MAGKLNAVRVRALVQPGTYGDGGGLYLQVRGPEQRSWLYRYKIGGRPRLMGLGVLADVTLAEARDKAAVARKLARQGVDPIDTRAAERTAANASRGLNTFREVAEAYQRGHAASWRNAKHRWQWSNTLERFAFPVMGSVPVAAVTVAEVMRVVEPLWHEKPETASRVRGRIETVLDYATARGWRSGDNPARWRGHLANLLPAPAKVRRVKHHAALPWPEVGGFMVALRAQPGIAALALQFAILTAARTGEVIGATWGEVDMASGVWTVLGERMKAGRDHRVPLSEPTMMLLRELQKLRLDVNPAAFVFSGARVGRGLSNTAMLMLLRRMGRPDLTTHGFRSAFRDWCAETTAYPAEVAEAALAHVVSDKVEAAYRRGDLFEKRRRLMEEWGAFATSSLSDLTRRGNGR
jgi:integrase